ncbi:MAG: glycosyltransferase [Candidatus Scalindua rubra]|nr:glycosyltransferase [Candidatus Scalindua rubra]
MKLLIIIDELEPGGAERLVVEYAKNLSEEKYDIKVCCLVRGGVFAEELKECNIPVIILGKKFRYDVSIIIKLVRLILRDKPDIVHTHKFAANTWGSLAAVISGVPKIFCTEHNVDTWKGALEFLIDRIRVRFITKDITVSNEVYNFYRTKARLPVNKLLTIYNGIDPDTYSVFIDKDKKLKELGISDGKPVVASIGRLVPQKAQHIFLEAIKILKSRGITAEYIFVGDGQIKDDLVRLSIKLGISGETRFLGFRKDVQELMAITDLAVITSVREGFSVALLELMATGVPVVATDVGGNSEAMVDGETGIIVPALSPVAVADAMEKLLTNPELRFDMGKKSKERVKKYFTVKKMIEKTEALYG